jgi:hypothetical protein
MASYGLLIALAGFRYSAPEKTLYLEPRLEVTPTRSALRTGKLFEVFFSTATGWGTLIIKEHEVSLRLEAGWLDVDKLVITIGGKTSLVEPRIHAVKGKKAVIHI